MNDAGAALETERLWLRPFTLADVAARHAIASHPDVWRYDGLRPRTLDETAALVAFRAHEHAGQGFGALLLWSKAERRPVDWCGLQLFLLEGRDESTPEVELFYGLERESWDRGLATEAGRTMLQFGFDTLHLRRICSVILRENARSLGVARRLGLRIEDHPTRSEFVVGVIDRA